jgi:hypothetical protein
MQPRDDSTALTVAHAIAQIVKDNGRRLLSFSEQGSSFLAELRGHSRKEPVKKVLAKRDVLRVLDQMNRDEMPSRVPFQEAQSRPHPRAPRRAPRR